MKLFKKGDPEVSKTIEDYLEIISGDSARSDAEILELMVQRGRKHGLSWQIIGLVPCLASREKLAGLGINFSDEFVEYDPESKPIRSGKLKKHDVWATAMGFKKQIMDCNAIDHMVLRSAEFTAINDALNSGSDPKNLQTSPITMFVMD